MYDSYQQSEIINKRLFLNGSIREWSISMITDLRKGKLVLDDISLVIDSSLSKNTFLSSELQASSKETVSNKEWSSFNTGIHRICGESFVLSLSFFGADLVEFHLTNVQPGEKDTWSDWSEEKEMARKNRHDKWLANQLGKPPYKFAWGQVFSVYDQKSGGSLIVVRYKLHPLSQT